MSSTSYSPLISKIYKSRNILLEILKERGYSVDDYTDFSVTEVQAMYNNKELDMLLEHSTEKKSNGENKKLYIKYHLTTRLGSSHI